MKTRKEPPKKIYVQWYGDQSPKEIDYDEEPFYPEVTWAEHRIFSHDVVYVRRSKKKKVP